MRALADARASAGFLKMRGEGETDATPNPLVRLIRRLRAPMSPQQRRCYWISNKRTNHRQHQPADAEGPNDLPAFAKQLVIVVGGQQVRIPQKLDTGGRNSQRAAKKKSSDSVGGHDDRNQRQQRVVNESAGVNRNLVKAKEKSNQRCDYCVQPKEWGEGDENSDRESQRRSLRWIIKREQTAKGGTKHRSSFRFRV